MLKLTQVWIDETPQSSPIWIVMNRIVFMKKGSLRWSTDRWDTFQQMDTTEICLGAPHWATVTESIETIAQMMEAECES